MARVIDPGTSGSTAPASKPPAKKKAAPKTVTTWRQILFNGKKFVLSANDYGNPSSGYSLGYHTGQDISMGGGTSIYTPMGGRVVKAGHNVDGSSYGNAVLIQMDNGDYIFFAHLNTVGIKAGKTRIPAGTYIGTVGQTGHASGTHLHLEIRKKSSGGKFGSGNFYDPVTYLSRMQAPASIRAPITQLSPDWMKENGGNTGGDTNGEATGSTSTSTSSGGGGGGKVAGFTKADYYKWLDANFGSIKILREMDAAARKELGGKSIDWLVDELAKKKITDPSIVATYMAQTGWFKKYGADTSLRLVAEKQRPGVFKTEVAAHTAAIKAQLGALGVTLSDAALGSIARNSYVYGWDAAQALDEAQKQFTKTGAVTYDGGTIGEAQDDLEAAAFQLGVNVTQQDIDSMRRDVVDGKGYQSQLDDLRERSAKLYTVYSEQIMAGKSLRDVASAYFDKAAQLLELGSPDQVDMNDPLFTGGKAFMAPDPNTGKMTEKGMWDFEKEVRKDPRWLKTQNARNTTFETADNVLQLMGLK